MIRSIGHNIRLEDIMKKYILLLLLAVMLVLGACGNGEDTSDASDDKKAEDPQTEQGVNSSDMEESDETAGESAKEEKEAEENKKPAANHEFAVKYSADEQSVQLVKPDGTTEILAARSASEPLESPDGKKAAYVSSIEWEELSDVYIVNLEDGTQNVLLASENEQKPKKVVWENDENVLVLVGYAYGTVSVGGNIYRVNLETKEKSALTNYEGDIQITDFKIENSVLKYSGIKYTDDNFNESVEYSNEKPL